MSSPLFALGAHWTGALSAALFCCAGGGEAGIQERKSKTAMKCKVGGTGGHVDEKARDRPTSAA